MNKQEGVRLTSAADCHSACNAAEVLASFSGASALDATKQRITQFRKCALKSEILNIQFIEEHHDFEPLNKRGVWIFKLDRDFTCNTPFTGRDFVAKWLRIERSGRVTVPRAYAWDGCTPKWAVFDLFIVGTPDGIVDVETAKAKTYYASLVHDALYQYHAWHHVPRREIDHLFLHMMREAGFSLNWLYYGVVSLLGGLFTQKKHQKRHEVSFDSK